MTQPKRSRVLLLSVAVALLGFLGWEFPAARHVAEHRAAEAANFFAQRGPTNDVHPTLAANQFERRDATNTGWTPASVGSGASNIAAGNDVRFCPAPSGAGKMCFDNGTTYVASVAGTPSQVWVGGTTPGFNVVPAAALTVVPAASLTGTATQPLGTLPLRTMTGNTWAAPVAANVSAFATRAANGANAFTLGGVFPDYRNILICLNAGWDGGNVTCSGTDATGGSVSLTASSVGACVNDSKPWQTITTCTKTTVGVTTNTATVGYGACLGIPTQRRALRSFSGIPAGFGSVNGVGDVVLSPSGTGTTQDTCTQFTTALNGVRNFAFLGFWN